MDYRTKINLLLMLSILFIGTYSNANTTEKVSQSIPEPESWAFPAVIESAKKLARQNIEGKLCNRFGLAYPLAEYKTLNLASLSVDELQNYADVVTHAYPDAISMRSPEDCSDIPLNKVNAHQLVVWHIYHVMQFENHREKNRLDVYW